MQNSQDAIREAMKMAQTPAGKQLIQLLQSTGGQDLQKVMERANAGDYAGAKNALSALLQSEEARKLLNQMGGPNGPNGR
jgi:hypothetical protein